MRHGTCATSMVCNATASQQVCAALKFSFALKRRAGRFLPALAGLVCLFVAAPAAGAEMGNTPRAATWVTDGPVYAVVRTTDTVYICGAFHNVGPSGGTWTPRNHIAALDASTGFATDWNPNADSYVNALAVSGDGLTVYAGGQFTFIGGQTRNRIAALNATGNAITTWNPNANNVVLALAVSGDGLTVYAGGGFTTVNGTTTRMRIAALDATGAGTATTWNPNANDIVNALAVSGDGTTVYAGGQFTNIGGQPRKYIAALDAAGNAITTWNPSASGNVSTIAVSGTTVYVGGAFVTSIGGASRNRIAALNASDGLATAWNPNANSYVYALAVSGTTVYAGGAFTTVNGTTPRNRLAALNATGTATTWDPNAGNYVGALAVSGDGSTVYAGGGFMTIGGVSRTYFAQFCSVPTAPTNPGATAVATDSITWTWQDNSSDETGFKVYSGVGPTAPDTVTVTTIAGATQWQHTGLTPNMQYAFQTAATNGYGDSAKTENFTTWTLAVEPVAPTVTAKSDSELDVKVSADANPESTVFAIRNVTSGNWVQANGSGGASPVWATRTGWGTVTVIGLARLTLYRFTVTARNDGGVETVAGPEGSASTLPVGLSMMSVE
ncbi:MAG: fibronectin type III domain-containing protein [Candidatus Sumerlaeota bacterium]|nr:fibronectin type III domain-containing protein [Candidatus Sumerlaeota bacterium]